MRSYEEVAERVLERRDAWLKRKKKKRQLVMRAALGTGLSAAVLTGLLIWYNSSDSNMENDKNVLLAADGAENADSAVGNVDFMAEGADAANRSTGSPADNAGSSAVDGKQTLPSTEGDGAIFENAPGTGTALQAVSYDSLKIPEMQFSPEILIQYGSGSASEADVLPFDESMLSDCCAIFEGTITDMYLKTYSYDTYDDKFGEKELYHNRSSSVVYELNVDKVWYGDTTIEGTAVLIEDETYLTDSYFSLMIGGRYVIPLRDAGETKYIWKEYAGGDITRDSRYTSLYPHHPQITVTEDDKYIVTEDWETLCSGNAQNIILELPEDEFVEYHPENQVGENGLITTEWRTILIPVQEARYYYDKLKLIENGEFFIQLNKLVESLP